MSLAGFMKQINKTSQFLSEKVGGNKGTELEPDFVELGRKLDAVNEGVESMQGRTKEYLQPNTNMRTMVALQSSVQNARGQATTVKYQYEELNLAEVFNKLGGSLTDMAQYSSSLVELGTAFGKLSEAKDEVEARVKQNFLDPLYEMQQNDLKEIAHHRKKFESRRLDFDYKKRKGDKVTAEEMEVADDKFESSKEICYATMTNFLGREVEHISQLHEFANALREHYQQCTHIMDSVTGALSQKMSMAASMPREERKINRKLVSENSFEVIGSGKDSIGSIDAPSAPPSWPVHQQPCCQALYNFDAENDGELEFNDGDMIEITARLNEEWLEGTLNGRKGYFPASYVEIIVPI